MVWGKIFFDRCSFERGEGVKLLFGECTFVPELEGELELTRKGTRPKIAWIALQIYVMYSRIIYTSYMSISISLLSL